MFSENRFCIYNWGYRHVFTRADPIGILGLHFAFIEILPLLWVELARGRNNGAIIAQLNPTLIMAKLWSQPVVCRFQVGKIVFAYLLAGQTADQMPELYFATQTGPLVIDWAHSWLWWASTSQSQSSIWGQSQELGCSICLRRFHFITKQGIWNSKMCREFCVRRNSSNNHTLGGWMVWPSAEVLKKEDSNLIFGWCSMELLKVTANYTYIALCAKFAN